VPIPSHIRKDVPIRGAMDNFDHEEATFSGINGAHDTILVLFQDKQNDVSNDNQQEKSVMQLQKTSNQSNTGQITGQQIIPCMKPNRRGQISNLQKPIYDDANIKTNIKDILWYASRFNCRTGSTNNDMPSWSAFNSLITPTFKRKTMCGYTPIIPNPATEFDTIYTAMVNFQDALKQVQQTEGSLWCDEGVYRIAKELQLIFPEKFSNLFLGMGAFHMEKIVIACIGNYLHGSGAMEILVQTESMGPPCS
jgi:hypothetical protein